MFGSRVDDDKKGGDISFNECKNIGIKSEYLVDIFDEVLEFTEKFLVDLKIFVKSILITIKVSI